MPGAIFCPELKPCLGFTEQPVKVQRGAARSPSGTQGSCMKLGANCVSATVRHHQEARCEKQALLRARSRQSHGCTAQHKGSQQCWGWSTQKSGLHSTAGTVLRRQKNLNGEIRRGLFPKINVHPQVMWWTSIEMELSCFGIPCAPSQSLSSLVNQPMVVLPMGSTGNQESRHGVLQCLCAVNTWQSLTAFTAHIQSCSGIRTALLSSCFALRVITFCFIDKNQVFYLLSATEPRQGADSLHGAQRCSTAPAGSSFFRAVADADKQIPAGRKVRSWCLIWASFFTFSFERLPLNQHKRLSKAARTPLLQ